MKALNVSGMPANWESRAVSMEDAMKRVPGGARLFVHGAAATPTPLLYALVARRDLEGVTLYHLHTSGPAPFAESDVAERFRSVSFFVGPALRRPIAEGRADFLPIFLSQIPGLFSTGRIPLDVALVQLSRPDQHELCSLGTSVDAARAAVDHARIVIAEINDQMPRTLGATTVPLSRVDAFVRTSRPLHEHHPSAETAVEARIGELIADLVDDGATLQVGIGSIPDAVLRRLGNKHGLGVHTEMFSDGMIALHEGGVITNAGKVVHPGRTITSFVAGTRRLFDFVDDNPLVEFHPCDRTNDVAIVRKNPRVTAINSAIEIDLTGQICADSIGHTIFSGVGGQMDFMHAAARSQGGKPIIALPSTACDGTVSRIVSALKPGAGVVTTRGHAHWVVTEYGAVNLHGLTLRERADALISIAHPDFRSELRREQTALHRLA
jgi:4-hydroxybutyrate CoA-transferase